MRLGYMGALKVFETPSLRPVHRYFSPKNFMGFCSDRPYDECAYKIEIRIALPVPDILGVPKNFRAVPGCAVCFVPTLPIAKKSL